MRASPDHVELVRVLLQPLEEDLVEVFADEAALEGLREGAASLIDPEAEIIFQAAANVALGPFRGVDGLLAGWREWLSSFASYRVNVEDVFEHGDQVISLVRQIGETLHGGVGVPSPPSAAVFTVRDERIVRIVFYLDRTEAAEAEGFELP